MTEKIGIRSGTFPISVDGPDARAIGRLRARAYACHDAAKQIAIKAKHANDIGDVSSADAHVAVHDVELIRSAIYDVGAVLLQELQGITAILEKHDLGGLKLKMKNPHAPPVLPPKMR